MKQPSLVLGKGIGFGPHGKVFSANYNGRACAAKQVLLSESSLLLTALEDEVRKIEQLRNRHLIQLFGAYRGDGALTVLMDYVEGGSLERAILTRGRLTNWKDKARIAQEIVRGLDYLHTQDILHRDLKSANVLLTKNMEVKLCDFGLATMVQMTIDSFSMKADRGGGGGGRGALMDGGIGSGIKRTIRWMAPELLEDKPAFSTKSDMYALGMIMWEMAANKTPPFREIRDQYAVIERVREGTREVLPDDTPHDYRHWLEQCWDQDPAERPEAREMVTREDAPRLSRTASLSRMSSLGSTKFFGQTPDEDDTDRAIEMTGLEGADLRIILPGSTRTSQSSFQSMPPVSPTWTNSTSSIFSPRILSNRPSTQPLDAPSSPEPASEPPQHPRQFKDMDECRQQAEQDNPYAQFTLAAHLESESDTDGQQSRQSRQEEAFQWYQRAAKLGHLDAQHKVGAIYLSGRPNVPPNYREAARWLRKAAKRGHALAQNDLGVMFHRGILSPKDSSASAAPGVAGVASDTAASAAATKAAAGSASTPAVKPVQSASRTAQKEAFKWFLQAAVKGCAVAQCNLAWYPLHGRQVEQSDKEAVVWLRKAAQQGDDAAMNYLGWMYLYGRGVDKSDTLAFNWFLKAAMLGSADGQCNLGWMHMNGRGTPQNFSEAVVWLRKAIVGGGLAPAYYNLGWLYLRGEGVGQPSSSNALKLFRKAAKLGHADAQYCVGWMYARGDGVAEPNYDKAAVWLHKAADQDCLQAQHCLGWMYREGQVDATTSRKNDEMAVKWFRKAAEQGYLPSQICLAKMYKSGIGVPKDLNQARAWLKMAADQGSSYAIQKLEAIESK
ncbi:hypothetical protein BGW41_001976 [Actinomortierella wolfii]|nr:hypothetical protein BGW41_001976 [Actinomortierella wolfii]